MNIRKIAILVSLLAVLLAGTVLSAGAATPMHVSNFRLTYLSGQTKASLRVLDAMNRPVAGAKVRLEFDKEGLAPIYRSTWTGLFGYARFSVSLPRGTWKVCVDEIHKLGYYYNPAKDLCSSITVP